jgi:hypothetical protein
LPALAPPEWLARGGQCNLPYMARNRQTIVSLAASIDHRWHATRSHGSTLPEARLTRQRLIRCGQSSAWYRSAIDSHALTSRTIRASTLISLDGPHIDLAQIRFGQPLTPIRVQIQRFAGTHCRAGPSGRDHPFVVVSCRSDGGHRIPGPRGVSGRPGSVHPSRRACLYSMSVNVFARV